MRNKIRRKLERKGDWTGYTFLGWKVEVNYKERKGYISTVQHSLTYDLCVHGMRLFGDRDQHQNGMIASYIVASDLNNRDKLFPM